MVDFDFNIPTALKGWVGHAPQGRGALHIIISYYGRLQGSPLRIMLPITSDRGRSPLRYRVDFDFRRKILFHCSEKRFGVLNLRGDFVFGDKVKILIVAVIADFEGCFNNI